MAKKKALRTATGGEGDQGAPGEGGQRRYSQRVLEFGFIIALIMACASLFMSALYMYSFLMDTNSSVQNLFPKPSDGAAKPPVEADIVRLGILSETVMARLALKSCGVFVAMSFGFLGFSLFLIGIRGEMDLEAQAEKYSVKVLRMSPGVFVILISAVLTGLCVTYPVAFDMKQTLQSGGNGGQAAARAKAVVKEPPGPKGVKSGKGASGKDGGGKGGSETPDGRTKPYPGAKKPDKKGQKDKKE